MTTRKQKRRKFLKMAAKAKWLAAHNQGDSIGGKKRALRKAGHNHSRFRSPWTLRCDRCFRKVGVETLPSTSIRTCPTPGCGGTLALSV